MAREADGEVAVPPTLQALLAARLDQLEPAERRVLERGAVEGEVFHRGAVQALVRTTAQVTPRLAALVRKELIRPDSAQLPGDDAFRFRHLLIRDAAYDALPKATRAELHERFADWLEEHGADLVELDEILGYHLEQAARYKAELGQPDPELAERAGERLAAAGRRALWRGDDRAAARAARAGARADPAAPARRSPRARPRGRVTETTRRGGAIAEARRRAGARRRRPRPARRSLASSPPAAQSAVRPRPDVDELERLAREALPLLERAGDHAGLGHVWDALGLGVANFRGRFEEWAQAAEAGAPPRPARRSSIRSRPVRARRRRSSYGPRPADEALRTLDAPCREIPHPEPLLASCLAARDARPVRRGVGDRARGGRAAA